MFSRRSGRRGRPSRIGLLGQSIRSRWSQSNVERIVSHKQGYSRRLSMELLEDRQLLTVNVYFDNVNNQISIVDDYKDDALQTGTNGTFPGANNVQEDNDVTLSNGVMTPGRLRIVDPLGVILEPGVVGTVISSTEVEVNATTFVRIDLQGGNDRLTFADNFAGVATLTNLTVRGGDSAPSDALILNATAATVETVTISAASTIDEQTITGYASKTLQVRGYESILYDGDGNDNLIAEVGFGEATARVQNAAPQDTDEVISNSLPKVLFNELTNFTLRGNTNPNASTTATFVLGSLQGATTHIFASQDADTFIVEGDGGVNSFTASLVGGNLQVASGGDTITTTGMDAADLLKVVGLAGNDTLLVNIGGTAPILTPIEFGGGSGSDLLLVQGIPAPAIVDVVYTPRSQPDEGRLEYRGAAGARLMSIDFDDLEPVVDLVMAPTLIINGTPSSNAITYTVGANSGVVSAVNPTGAVTGQVTIDNAESIEFANKTVLTINANAGSDLINLNNTTNPAALTQINVSAGDPTAESDTVVVNDVDNATQPITVTAISSSGATVTNAQPVPVVVTQAELLIINGQNGGDTLQLQGSANADRFTHTPGDTVDSGSFSILAGAVTWLPIQYKALGAAGIVQVDGLAGNDTLIVRGTEGADTMNVSFPAAGTPNVELVNTVGAHVDVAGLNASIENLVVETLGDNDTIIVATPVLLTVGPPVGTFTVIGGDSDANTDKLIINGQAATVEAVTVRPDFNVPTDQDVVITANAVTTITDVTGVELIQYNGTGADDNLSVDFRAVNAVGAPVGTGVVDARVQNAANLTDEVLSNRLPDVRFSGVAGFTLQGSVQPTTATFVPKQLTGAATYGFASNNANDTFVIEGMGGIDVVTASRGAAVDAIIVATTGGATVTATGMTSTDLFKVNSLGGDDTLTVDSPNGPISTPILFDGGDDRDSLLVQNVPGIDEVIYTPGLIVDHGRLEYQNAADVRLMSIDFQNLEPVTDLVVAPTLTVNGTPASNAINVGKDPTTADAAARGLVSIDGFETMSFSGKTGLVVNALAGDDIVNVNLGAAVVIAALSTVTVNASDGNDTIRFQNLPTAAAFTRAIVNAGTGNDTIEANNIPVTTIKPLTLNGEEGNDTITGGPNGDTISGGTGDDTLIDSPGADIYDGGGGVDTLIIRGTAINDILSFVQNAPSGVAATNYTVNIINGPLAAPPTANVDQIAPTTAAAPSDPANRPSIELVRIEALAGDDAITVAHNDAYSDFTGTPPVENLANGRQLQTIPVHVVGDSPNASDRLVVQDNGIGDLVIHREAPDRRSGSIVVGGMAPITYESTERVDIIPLDNLGQTGSPALGRLIVFKDDSFETNESETNATPLGFEPVFIGLRNIDPGAVSLPPFGQIPGDEDWYEFRAQKIGTFRFAIFFEQIETLPSGRPGLPSDGNLRLDVFRADGTLLASSNTSGVTPINVDTFESIDVTLDPALLDVNGPLFVRVKGASLAAPDDPEAVSNAINNYDIYVTQVDREGPQVTDVFPNNLPEFDLFHPKSNLAAGTTPLIYSLTINIQDLPNRAIGDLYPALDVLIANAAAPGLYSVVGDHVGFVDINSVVVVNDPVIVGQPATATITLNFSKPLPDDRFTLTLSDHILDPAGNALDGESDASEPGVPMFPSGNNVPGGDFVARFTVDTRPEIGTSVAQDIDIDINGNYYWDPANSQIGNDATNVDISFSLAVQNSSGFLAPGSFNVNDLLFVGRFTNSVLPPVPPGTALPQRLYDQLGAYGYSSELATQRWLIDINGDGVISLPVGGINVITPGNDIMTSQGTLSFPVASAIPISGNFDGNAANGDEVGLYYAGNWGLDGRNGVRNFSIQQSEVFNNGLTGAPIVGDFDGDGLDDLAVFNNNTFYIDFAFNGFTGVNKTIVWGYPGTLDKPLAADIDQDGIDDLGLWEPRNSASLPREAAEWYFLVSGAATAPISSVTDESTFIATNLIGNTSIPTVNVEVRVLSTGAATSANFGAVRTASFNSVTGQITLNFPLPVAPSEGDIISIGGQAGVTLSDHAFRPVPFGNDISAEFGDELALPFVGNFDPPTLPTVVKPSTGIAGDYNNSGQATSADYTVWRGTFGSTASLLADGNHSGKVDAGDFVLWRKSAAAQASGSSFTASGTGMGLEAESPSTVSSVPESDGVQEVSPASATSSTLEDDSTSFAITTTIGTVSMAAPRVGAPAANLAVLDSAFSNMEIESPKKVVGASISPDSSTLDDDLLLLGMAEYSQAPMTMPLDGLADGTPASDDDAFDSALTDFAVETVLELAI